MASEDDDIVNFSSPLRAPSAIKRQKKKKQFYSSSSSSDSDSEHPRPATPSNTINGSVHRSKKPIRRILDSSSEASSSSPSASLLTANYAKQNGHYIADASPLLNDSQNSIESEEDDVRVVHQSKHQKKHGPPAMDDDLDVRESPIRPQRPPLDLSRISSVSLRTAQEILSYSSRKHDNQVQNSSSVSSLFGDAKHLSSMLSPSVSMTSASASQQHSTPVLDKSSIGHLLNSTSLLNQKDPKKNAAMAALIQKNLSKRGALMPEAEQILSRSISPVKRRGSLIARASHSEDERIGAGKETYQSNEHEFSVRKPPVAQRSIATPSAPYSSNLSYVDRKQRQQQDLKSELHRLQQEFNQKSAEIMERIQRQQQQQQQEQRPKDGNNASYINISITAASPSVNSSHYYPMPPLNLSALQSSIAPAHPLPSSPAPSVASSSNPQPAYYSPQSSSSVVPPLEFVMPQVKKISKIEESLAKNSSLCNVPMEAMMRRLNRIQRADQNLSQQQDLEFELQKQQQLSASAAAAAASPVHSPFSMIPMQTVSSSVYLKKPPPLRSADLSSSPVSSSASSPHSSSFPASPSIRVSPPEVQPFSSPLPPSNYLSASRLSQHQQQPGPLPQYGGASCLSSHGSFMSAASFASTTSNTPKLINQIFGFSKSGRVLHTLEEGEHSARETIRQKVRAAAAKAEILKSRWRAKGNGAKVDILEVCTSSDDEEEQKQQPELQSKNKNPPPAQPLSVDDMQSVSSSDDGAELNPGSGSQLKAPFLHRAVSFSDDVRWAAAKKQDSSSGTVVHVIRSSLDVVVPQRK